MPVETRFVLSPRDAANLKSQELRDAFLHENFSPQAKSGLLLPIPTARWSAAAIPAASPLTLHPTDVHKAGFFCQRRELGIFNLGGGGGGGVTVDGTVYPIAKHDCLNIGCGSRAISFASDDAATSAVFYFVS